MVSEALGNRSFLLLMAAYFVCGFQVVFIAVHLPAYLKDQGLIDPNVAVVALALIGLFNIFGSYYAGKLRIGVSAPCVTNAGVILHAVLKMGAGLPKPACRSRFQTAQCGCVQKAWS